MAKVTIDETMCKGCGLCVHFCPKQVLAIQKDKINKRGYNPAHPAHPEQCIGCAMCAQICPESAIEVWR